MLINSLKIAWRNLKKSKSFSLGGALVITISTVSYQAIRAALSNPVKSLRSE